jgi:hypothetical protein
VIDFRVRDFSGHVYNLESEPNWYTNNSIAVHNCKCTMRPVIEFDEGEAQ